MSTLMKRLVQLGPFVIVALVLLGGTKPAVAEDLYGVEEEIRCTQDLRSCYYRAAREDSWGDRWLSGLDCELTFVDCTRRAIIGR